MSPRQASLQRYILAGAIITTIAVFSYRSYTARSRSSRRPLRRANATRRRPSPSRRHQRSNATAAADPDAGGILTDEQLIHALNQDAETGASIPLGIHIPESAAEALTETGHAAQQARGARNGVNGREGRSGRRSSEHNTELSFDEETKENNENQNLLTLLYTIAQVLTSFILRFPS